MLFFTTQRVVVKSAGSGHGIAKLGYGPKKLAAVLEVQINKTPKYLWPFPKKLGFFVIFFAWPYHAA
jgi:hypothetical protein